MLVVLYNTDQKGKKGRKTPKEHVEEHKKRFRKNILKARDQFFHVSNDVHVFEKYFGHATLLLFKMHILESLNIKFASQEKTKNKWKNHKSFFE